MRLALFQPDIPQNTGALIRLAACLDVPLDIIEPCGFLIDDKRLRRAGLDYHAQARMQRHSSWAVYQSQLKGRLLLLTTRGSAPYTGFSFHKDDNLLMGRESAGVPDDVHAAAEARLLIPVSADCRSLNVALAAAMVLGEGLRQTALFPGRSD
ncbi:tRNA (cytidine(34)-2'-O)-methyltransferase [Pelagibius litoralis]|uniref:tRNA (cytidine(34)-2'-O)-methyltransferase n=1 Tax=Pelagibius litoralis TaxID=374515 RepID=A0A967F2D6_9PROT|nr:tRNA (cytidine(34)-2'-O)-methyltransferase [Pelagibius litoralis]NIA71650.1 tRNA (cytidine(34)-2'-O)-methyltransferase [Pelagibius litoralis]